MLFLSLMKLRFGRSLFGWFFIDLFVLSRSVKFSWASYCLLFVQRYCRVFWDGASMLAFGSVWSLSITGALPYLASCNVMINIFIYLYSEYLRLRLYDFLLALCWSGGWLLVLRPPSYL